MTLVFLTLISRPQNPLALEREKKKKCNDYGKWTWNSQKTLTLLHHTVLTDLWDISLLSSRCSSARHPTPRPSVCLKSGYRTWAVLCSEWSALQGGNRCCAGFRFLSPGFSPLPWIRLDSRRQAGAANRTRRATSSVSLRVWKIARLSFFPTRPRGERWVFKTAWLGKQKCPDFLIFRIISHTLNRSAHINQSWYCCRERFERFVCLMFGWLTCTNSRTHSVYVLFCVESTNNKVN